MINVSGAVELDHDTNEYGITCPKKNPTTSTKRIEGGLFRVHSVFSRKFQGPKDRKGDNCPFIYAYKGKDQDLSLGFNCARDVLCATKEIIATFAKSEEDYDFIVPVPSKHLLAQSLSRLVHRELNGSDIIQGLFRKATHEDVLAEVGNLPINPHMRKRIERTSEIDRSNGQEFSIGHVRTELRKFITPLYLDFEANFAAGDRILLIDDLVASGQTLVHARQSLLDRWPDVNVEALALFGPFGGRFRG